MRRARFLSTPVALLILAVILIALITPTQASTRSPRCANVCRRWYNPAKRDCTPRWLYRGCRLKRCTHFDFRRKKVRGRWRRRRVVRRGWQCTERFRPIPPSLPPSPSPSVTPLPTPPPFPGTRLEDVDLVVTFLWEGNRSDLDSAVTMFGEKAGWECPQEFKRNFVFFQGDDNSVDGTEQHVILLEKAFRAGILKTGMKVTADLFAGWYTANGQGSTGPASVQVFLQQKSDQNEVDGTLQTLDIAPGAQNGCATKKVATLTVNVAPLSQIGLQLTAA